MSDIDAAFDDALGGFAGTNQSVFAKADGFIAVALRLLKDGVDKSTVKEAVERAWNRIVVPYDMPWVPEFVERMLERRALAMILDAIDGAKEA